MQTFITNTIINHRTMNICLISGRLLPAFFLLLMLGAPKSYAETAIGPLMNPHGWHIVTPTGIQIIKDDTRYAHSKNWIMLIAESLVSDQPAFVGQISTQGAWGIKRQDFSIQVLSLAKQSNCKIWSKEFNSKIYKPFNISLGNRSVWGYKTSNEYQKVYTPAERACEFASVRDRTCEIVKCKKWADKQDDYATYLVNNRQDADQLYQQLLEKK